jgi:hypothetical protein
LLGKPSQAGQITPKFCLEDQQEPKQTRKSVGFAGLSSWMPWEMAHNFPELACFGLRGSEAGFEAQRLPQALAKGILGLCGASLPQQMAHANWLAGALGQGRADSGWLACLWL